MVPQETESNFYVRKASDAFTFLQNPECVAEIQGRLEGVASSTVVAVGRIQLVLECRTQEALLPLLRPAGEVGHQSSARCRQMEVF